MTDAPGIAHLAEHVYLTSAAGEEKARTTEEFSRRYPDGANGQTGDRYTVFATTFPEKELDAELQDAAARMGDLRVTAEDLERGQESSLRSRTCSATSPPSLLRTMPAS